MTERGTAASAPARPRPAPAPTTTLRADIAVVGGGRDAVQAARRLAAAAGADNGGSTRNTDSDVPVVLVTSTPITACTVGLDVPASSVLAAAGATGHTWAFGYERARAALADAARPARLPDVTVLDGHGARIVGKDGPHAVLEIPPSPTTPDDEPNADANADHPVPRQPRRATRILARRLLVVPPTAPTTPGVTGLPDITFSRPEDVPTWEDLPFSLVVLGGGATGCELAAAFAAWGSRVTVVERADRLLPTEHPAASAAVERRLADAGVRVLLGGTVTRVAPTLDNGVYVGTDVGGDVAATHLVLATGHHHVAIPGADALETDLRRPRRLWRPSTWRRPDLLTGPDETAPVVLATTPQVAHVGLAQAPEGGALTATEVAVPGVDDGRLILVTVGDHLRGCTAIGDGAGLAIGEAALALGAGIPLSRWADVGRSSAAVGALDGHANSAAVDVLGAAWGQAFARALAGALKA